MENQVELTIEGFENWLNSFEDKGFNAGYPKRSHFCPLAKYLQSTTNNKDWSVDAHSYWNNQEGHSLPKWARLFVEAVDYCDDETITVDEVEVILANIKDSFK